MGKKPKWKLAAEVHTIHVSYTYKAIHKDKAVFTLQPWWYNRCKHQMKVKCVSKQNETKCVGRVHNTHNTLYDSGYLFMHFYACSSLFRWITLNGAYITSKGAQLRLHLVELYIAFCPYYFPHTMPVWNSLDSECVTSSTYSLFMNHLRS